MKRWYLSALGIAVICAIIIVAAANRDGVERLEKRDSARRFEARFAVIGTDARLVAVCKGADQAQRAFAAAELKTREVERLMSAFDTESDVGRLNAHGAERAVQVAPDTLAVIRKALEVSRLSGGAFDVSYVPLREPWQQARREGKEPSDEAINAAMDRIGYQGIVIEKGGTVRFAKPGMAVDLGGIAKGYAIDLATEALIEAGVAEGIADIGGDLRLFGRPEHGGKWRIEVRRPPDVEEVIMLELPPCAVATSGDYERWFRVGDKRYSHIMDPRTGRPVPNVPSATVVAPDATTADALATAISVLAAEDGVRLVDSLPDVECLIMTRLPDGGVARRMSAGFADLIEKR